MLNVIPHDSSFATWDSDENDHWHTCSCGEILDKASHTGGTATCTNKAVCGVCGTAYGELDPDNHDLVKTDAKAATHFEAGNIEYYTCADCGKIFSDKDGKNEIKLADTVLNVIPHDSSFATWDSDENEHWHTCSCGEILDKANHTGGTATCTDKAICEVCSTAYGELDPDNHDLVKTEAKAATHYEVGNIEYYTCADCGKIFSDKDGKNEIKLADTVLNVIPHDSSFAERNSDESDHWHICSCGEILNEEAHSFEWITDKEATETENGSKHKECTVCGYEKAAVKIAATGKPDSPKTEKPDSPKTEDNGLPKTGDSSYLILWAALFIISGGSLTTLGVTKKRKKSV